jgi:hypothetical protein
VTYICTKYDGLIMWQVLRMDAISPERIQEYSMMVSQIFQSA